MKFNRRSITLPPIKLPSQLKNKSYKFIKIKDNTKQPLEKNWNKGVFYSYKNIEFNSYLKQAKSYGILCGYGDLVVIDCDTPEMHEVILTNIPPTFTIKTNRGYHCYYIVPGFEKTKPLDLLGDHLGEIISFGKFVIGPNSTHPSGKQYSIIEDYPITKLTLQQLKESLYIFFKKTQIVKLDEDEGLQLSDIIDISTLKQVEKNVYQGPHPVHDSESGNNFRIDLNKKCWYCYRCGTGGGWFSLLAVKEGIIDCDEAIPSGLRGTKGLETVKIATKKYGLKRKYQTSHKKDVLRAIKKLKNTEEIQRKGYITTKQLCVEIGMKSTRGNLIRLGMFINNELKLPTTKGYPSCSLKLTKKNKEKLYRHFSKYRIFNHSY